MAAYLAEYAPAARTADARRPDRVQRGEPRRGKCGTSARSSSCGRRPRAASTAASTSTRSRPAGRFSRAEGIDQALAEHRLDALVAPTGAPAWLTDFIRGDNPGGGFSSPAAVAGYPHITVPAGHVRGLPCGISFVGTAWSEPVLLRHRLRVRTGDEPPPAAHLSADRRPGVTVYRFGGCRSRPAARRVQRPRRPIAPARDTKRSSSSPRRSPRVSAARRSGWKPIQTG